MANTTFTNGITLTDAEWFNDVNKLTYEYLLTVKNSAYGAVGDGSTDDYTALGLANTAAAGKTLIWPAGTYKIGTNLSFGSTVSHLFLKGATVAPTAGRTVTFNGQVVAMFGNIAAGAGTTTFAHDGNVFFNSAAGSGGFGFGVAVPSGTDDFVHIQRDVDTSVGILVKNKNTGASSETFWHLFADAADAGASLRASVNSVAGSSLADIVASQNTVFSIIQASAAPIDIYTNNARVWQFESATGVVNYWKAKGGGTGSSIQMTAAGESNVSMIFNSAGTGSIFFRTDGGTVTQLEIERTASAANRVVVTGAAAGANPSIRASAENLVLGSGSALATGATAGYVMIPSCAGTPTGAPTGYAAGRIPIQYDSSTNKIFVYNGSWRSVSVT
jgi:hypothetical protein